MFIADLHIHSKYSRATSKQLDLAGLALAAKIKGIDVLGTGDFTHPAWFQHLQENLTPAEPGLYKLKFSMVSSHPEPIGEGSFKKETLRPTQGDRVVRFLLTSEISCIYSKGGKVRKIHILVFAPSLEIVAKINAELAKIGNLKADGRPILGLDAKELLKIVLDVSPDCLVVPGHIWTPWFSLFGSKSGFDTIEECFEDYSKYIYAVETGLSSDPAMNWRLSQLDKLAIISCSDAHSLAKLGREACCFETSLSYNGIIKAIKMRDPKKFLYTIEFFPEEGKYHYDGHRECNVVLSPKETKKYNGLCPVCAKPLTVGVLNRVEELADRPIGFKPKNVIPFKSLIPLQEIIAEVLGVGVLSKKVGQVYQALIERFGSEFAILLDVLPEELLKGHLPAVAKAISKVRKGQVNIAPGYDGVYGKVSIFTKTERAKLPGQKLLF